MDMLPVRRVLQEFTEAGMQCVMIDPHLGHVATATGKNLAVTKTFYNTASVMFDALLIPGGAGSSAMLRQLGAALHFVLEAYKHCKPIYAVNEGARLLASLGLSEISQEFIAAIALHRHWDRVNVDAVPA